MARSKKTANEVLKEAVPGRFQVSVSYYDPERRVYRPVPGAARYVEVDTTAEAKRFMGRVFEAAESKAEAQQQ